MENYQITLREKKVLSRYLPLAVLYKEEQIEERNSNSRQDIVDRLHSDCVQCKACSDGCSQPDDTCTMCVSRL